MDYDYILQKNFTSSFRKGYATIKGYTMPQRFQELHSVIENLPINEDDIWISSFPKTGTTWTQEMVWLITHNLDYEGAKVNLGYRSPFLELSTIFDHRDLMRTNKNFQPPSFLADSLKYIQSQRSPLNIKTHLPWELLPKEIRDGLKKPRIIYITRNPKDTFLSYFHHAKLIEGYKGDYEEFSELFLADKLAYCPFWKHVLSYYERRNDSNILFLRFEDMKKDLKKIIRKVSNFLNYDLTNNEIESLNQHLSFKSMKANRSVNYTTLVELHKEFQLIQFDGTFMRSGNVGEYKTKMNSELLKRFDSWTMENLKNTQFTTL